MLKPTILVVLVLVLAGCVTTKGTRAKWDSFGVAEATETQVADCEFLGTVHGASVFKLGTPRAKASHAKTKVYKEAKALGATHVVLSGMDWGYWKGGESNARAYRCPDTGEEASE